MENKPESPKATLSEINAALKLDTTQGQRAYEGYCKHTDWKSLITGAFLPPWSELRKEIQDAWEAAALAIKPCYCLGRHTIERVAEDSQLSTELVDFVAADDLFHKNPYALYDELILAVATVHEGESRHETAHRYICERETVLPSEPVNSNPYKS